jgi:hypothetical protein
MLDYVPWETIEVRGVADGECLSILFTQDKNEISPVGFKVAYFDFFNVSRSLDPPG